MLEREARVLELLMREGLLPCPDTPFLDIDALSTRFAVRRLFAPDAELFCALAEKNLLSLSRFRAYKGKLSGGAFRPPARNRRDRQVLPRLL